MPDAPRPAPTFHHVQFPLVHARAPLASDSDASSTVLDAKEPSPRCTLHGSLDPTTGVFYKAPERARARTALACDKCRARKAKCSGDRPVCERCRARELACHYTAPERQRWYGTGAERYSAGGCNKEEIRGASGFDDFKPVQAFVTTETSLGHGTRGSMPYHEEVDVGNQTNRLEGTADNTLVLSLDPISYSTNFRLSFDTESSPELAFLESMLSPEFVVEQGELNPYFHLDRLGTRYPMACYSPSSLFDVSLDQDNNSPAWTPSISTSASTSASPVLPLAHSDGLPTTSVNSYPGSRFLVSHPSPSPFGSSCVAPLTDHVVRYESQVDSHALFGESAYLDVDCAF